MKVVGYKLCTINYNASVGIGRKLFGITARTCSLDGHGKITFIALAITLNHVVKILDIVAGEIPNWSAASLTNKPNLSLVNTARNSAIKGNFRFLPHATTSGSCCLVLTTWGSEQMKRAMNTSYVTAWYRTWSSDCCSPPVEVETAGVNVSRYLKHHLAKAGKNATYTSKTIQNELIEVTGEWIRQQILNKVRNTYFSVLADEVATMSKSE